MKNNYLNILNTTAEHNKLYNCIKPWVSYNKENNKVYYNKNWVEIGGIKYADKLLGATTPYTNDALLFQWGDLCGRKEGISGNTNYDYGWSSVPYNNGNNWYNENAWAQYSGQIFDNNGQLKKEYDAAYLLMPKSPLEGYHWRTANVNEILNLISHILKIHDTTVQAVDGEIITLFSNGDSWCNNSGGLSFGESSASTENILFLSYRGQIQNTKTIVGYNSFFSLWTSSNYESDPSYSYSAFMGGNNSSNLARNGRYCGYCILPVLSKD